VGRPEHRRPADPRRAGASRQLGRPHSPAVAAGCRAGGRTQLTNTVEITTANDANPDDNRHERSDVWVGSPRWDGHVNKEFTWGQLAPGHQVAYSLHIRNNGNNGRGRGAHRYAARRHDPGRGVAVDRDRQRALPARLYCGGLAIWDLGVMEPGQWYNLDLRLALSGGLQPAPSLPTASTWVSAARGTRTTTATASWKWFTRRVPTCGS